MNKKSAQKLDEILMSPEIGFNLSQLMELAGQGVALSIYDHFSPRSCLVVCGKGNNGGDGMVCARYLKMFGFEVEVMMVGTFNEEQKRLLEAFEVNIRTVEDLNKYELVVDAVFGFGYRPPLALDLCALMSKMALHPLVVSIDVPSGWEASIIEPHDFIPYMNVSLSAPKRCMEDFKGVHYVAGRFVPDRLKLEMIEMKVPEYDKSSLFIRIDKQK